jgi:hypothetical protein
VDFGECLNELEVSDLNFSSCLFIWSDKQEEVAFVARKLDRVVANEEWISCFGGTTVDF